jgi:hypothetical protein
VGQRALVGSRYLGDPRLRREYDEEIAPRTRIALGKILAEIGPALGGVRRVIDLGAGTGAAGETVRSTLAAPGRPIDVVGVDQVPGPGVVVADVRWQARPAGVEGEFDLLVAAHLLNELAVSMSFGERVALVFAWCRELLTEEGLCILIEPALRQTSRDLLAIRDRMVSAGFAVLAPCFWQGPCPALARERDWCHDSAPWGDGARPGRSRVDFSYIVLARRGERTTDRRIFRVVSDPLREKGRLRLFGCGPAGRHPLVRLDRERSEENQGFEEAERGDVLVVGDGTQAADGLRVFSNTRVERRSR